MRGKKWVKLYILIALISGGLMTALSHNPGLIGLPPKLDPTNRLIGWKELGDRVGLVFREMSLRPVPAGLKQGEEEKGVRY